MAERGRSPDSLAQPMVGRIHRELAARGAPVFVGLDGRSGSGKSTLSAAFTGLLTEHDVSSTVIEGDDFYCGGSAATWDGRTAAVNADHVMDWRLQRDVLQAVRDRGVAEWHPFDWESGDWDADTVPLSAQPARAVASDVVVLEGAYRCRPELHDLLDLRVLLDVPADRRRRQLLEREGERYRADWEARWSAAEEHYFGSVMPPSHFDLVLGHT